MVGGRSRRAPKKKKVSVGLFSTFRQPPSTRDILAVSFTVTALLTTTTGTLLSTTLQRIFSTDSGICMFKSMTTTRRFYNAHFIPVMRFLGATL
jgi:hypothetical protein